MEKIIIAQLSIQETKIDKFLILLRDITKASLEETGCLVYKSFTRINKENEFIFYEKYKNEEAVNMHNSSTHLKDFLNSVMPILEQEPIIENF